MSMTLLECSRYGFLVASGYCVYVSVEEGNIAQSIFRGILGLVSFVGFGRLIDDVKITRIMGVRSSHNVFPENPDDFNPEGLTKIGPFSTKNGKVIKWLDGNKKAVYEWDEDLSHGPHYHRIGEDGNSRIPNSDGDTHFKPGDPID